MIACSQKSGSTYVARVIQEYLEAPFGEADVSGYYWAQEQNLTADLLGQLISEKYVLQMHLRPYPPNLAAMASRNIAIVLLWRNIADSIVSLDEHIRSESELVPWCYIFDRDNFLSLEAQRRYQYLIDYAVPYYLSFYLSWRRQDAIFRHYENMVACPYEFFATIVSGFGKLDGNRLSTCLRTKYEMTRYNVGVVGRSVDMFSVETRGLLEQKLNRHPESEQLDVLLDELPWNNRASRLVRALNQDEIFLIRDGRKYRIANPSWIHSRPQAESRLIHQMGRAELDELDEGRTLL